MPDIHAISLHDVRARALAIRDHLLPLALAKGWAGPKPGAQSLFWRPAGFTIAHATKFLPHPSTGGLAVPQATLDVWHGDRGDPVLCMGWTVYDVEVSAFIPGVWEDEALALGAVRH